MARQPARKENYTSTLQYVAQLLAQIPEDARISPGEREEITAYLQGTHSALQKVNIRILSRGTVKGNQAPLHESADQ